MRWSLIRRRASDTFVPGRVVASDCWRVDHRPRPDRISVCAHIAFPPFQRRIGLFGRRNRAARYRYRLGGQSSCSRIMATAVRTVSTENSMLGSSSTTLQHYPDRVAFVAKRAEWGHPLQCPSAQPRDPPMRIYISARRNHAVPRGASHSE